MAYENDVDWIEHAKRSSLPVAPVDPELARQEMRNIRTIVARCFIELGFRLPDVHLDEIRPIRPKVPRGRGFSIGFRGSYIRVTDLPSVPPPDLVSIPDLVTDLLRMEWTEATS